jgi:murein DD-endopeptidase MepM/ murein hydrolase activator NlpD
VDVGGVDEAPDAFGLIPEGFEVPVIPRTAGRNTRELVARLERVTEVGIPLEEALIEGMGRFPVAGLAWYSDDWWNPRFTPYFHLHEGLDIFAEFGTPVRAPDSGVVTRVVDGPVGGIALWMRGRDGTQYYFAHLEGYAGGMEAGRTVETGTVIGYVGNTGNASGGAPHLHFEIHDPNAIPPKPFVDAWLGDAETAADAWVDARMADVLGHRELVRTERSAAGLLGADLAGPSATLEYSILLTVLDPVGGSVGLLPRLPLAPAPGTEVSDAMLREMLRLRVDGGLFSSSALRLPFGDGALRTAEAGAG